MTWSILRQKAVQSSTAMGLAPNAPNHHLPASPRRRRFSREGTLETLQHLQKLSAWGVGWRSYQESYLDSCGPFRDVVVSLMASLAKQERLRISERTKAGLKRAKRQGKVLGRPRVKVDVKKVRKLQANGVGLRAIAEKTGWSLSSIMRALKNAQ